MTADLSSFKRSNRTFASFASISPTNVAVFLFLFGIIFLDSTIVFYAVSILFSAAEIIELFISKKAFKLGYLGVFFGFFILYNFALIALGLSIVPDQSLNRLFVMIANLVIFLLLMNHIIDRKNRLFFMKSSIILVFIQIMFFFLFHSETLLYARFGHLVPYIFGFDGEYNANIIGYWCCFCIIFCLYFIKNHSKKFLLYWLLVLLFSVVVFLTGSRKAVLMLLMIIVLIPFFGVKTIKNKLLVLVVSGVAVLSIYSLMMNIPFLYELIGYRLNDSIVGFFTTGSYEETSAFHRNAMIDIAKSLVPQRPFYGFGLDSFSSLSTYGVYAHNNYYEIIISSGFIGLFIYYIPYILLLFYLIKNIKCYRNESALCISCIISMVVLDYAIVSYLSRGVFIILYFVNAVILDLKGDKNESGNTSRRLWY